MIDNKTIVIVSTMNRSGDDWDMRLCQSLNLNTPAVIVNQCPDIDKKIKEYVTFHKNKSIIVINSKQKGIGRSRNQGLLEIDNDLNIVNTSPEEKADNSKYVLLADDDIRYVDDYSQLVSYYFEVLKCDALVFNIKAKNLSDTRVKDKEITHTKRVRWYDCLRYGAVRIAVKKEFLDKHNIWFSLEHGGGAKYQYGEDSLFIHDLLKAGAKIMTVPETLCSCDYSESSWFKGYDEKFFYDMGVLFYKLFNTHGKVGLKGKLLLTVMVLKNKDKLEKVGRRVALQNAWNGYTKKSRKVITIS